MSHLHTNLVALVQQSQMVSRSAALLIRKYGGLGVKEFNMCAVW